MKNKTITKEEKREYIISFIIAFVITMVYMIGYVTSRYFVNNVIPKSKIMLGVIFIICLIFNNFMIKKIYNFFKYQKKNEIEKKYIFFSYNKKSLFFISLIIFIAYLPYLIDCFPGYVSYDFAVQIRQALNCEELTNHHPYIHTKIIGLFLKLR